MTENLIIFNQAQKRFYNILKWMQKKQEILNEISPDYFWDVNYKKLDPGNSKRLIIERVFTMGKAQEIMKLINFYGEKEVISVLKDLNYLDPKTLNFVSKYFNLPLQSFKCYKRKQLNPQFWD